MCKKRVVGRLFFTLLLVLAVNAAVSAQLQVHFLDVGQAESILLQTDDFTLLIDAGDRGRNDVVPQLIAFGVEKIDLFVLTHPHADHIGQAVEVLETFEVAEVWMSGSDHYTILYEEVLDAILATDAAYNEPRRGDVYRFGDLTLQILNPAEVRADGKADLHDECLVIRAVYREVAFLFTGDMERKTENKLLRSQLSVQASILNLGHHASRTSSSLTFLEAVAPEAAIYSAGRCNIYGHPHLEVIDRLKILQVPVYGTCLHGTITVVTDGINYQIFPARNESVSHIDVPAGYVDLNSASREELQLVLHIGPIRAAQIIRLRKERPFTSLDDLARVSGLGKKRISGIKRQGLACVRSEDYQTVCSDRSHCR